MIPKVIHYCWFGEKPIPEKDKKCIESWKKFCPDYKIIQWNENNYDVTKNKYMFDAYKAKKWGFVPDYARIDIVYNYGGIYLDTDVEIVRNIDELLQNRAFMGFEEGKSINPGVGFGAEKGHPGLKKILEMYETLEFLKDDGTYNLTPSPVMNSELLKKYGAVMNNNMQEVIGIRLYPSEYLCPMSYTTGIINKTNNTYSIHHFSMSWVDPNVKKWHLREQIVARRIGTVAAKKVIYFISFPDRVVYKIKKIGFRRTIRFAFRKVIKMRSGKR